MLAPARVPAYPKRDAFYVLKLIDAAESHALELGREVCWLLTVIVRTEDRLRYSGPVAFWNSDLMKRAGFSSRGTFAKARDKAVELGWLVYSHGSRSKAPTYFTSIPADADRTESGTQVESDRSESRTQPVPDQERYRSESGTQTPVLRSESGTPSVLSPSYPKTPNGRGFDLKNIKLKPAAERTTRELTANEAFELVRNMVKRYDYKNEFQQMNAAVPAKVEAAKTQSGGWSAIASITNRNCGIVKSKFVDAYQSNG